MPDVVPALLYYAAAQACAWACLPAVSRFFHGLPDRGFAFSKLAGILGAGLLFWIGWAWGLWRNDAPGAWIALLAAALLAWAVRRGAPAGSSRPWCMVPGWRWIVAEELLLATVYVGWLAFRGFDPGVMHTEQPMDLMFMSALCNSAVYPPRDAWLSGYPIAYYYLGYWLLLFPGRLAALPPTVIYNTGQALWYGLLWLGCFGVAANLLMLARPVVARWRDLAPGLAGGLIAAGAVALGSNVLGLRAALHAVKPGEWWWWPASRAVTDRGMDGAAIQIITEFPFFSYLLGDNHPHVLAQPLLLLLIGFALAILVSPPRPAAAGRLAAVPGGWPGLIFMAVAVGSLVGVNTWDFPVGLALVAAAWAWRRHSLAGPRAAVRDTIYFILVVGAVSLVLFFPYLATAQSQLRGLAFNRFGMTSPAELAGHFGFFLPGLGLLAALVAAGPGHGRPTAEATAIYFIAGLTALGVALVLAAEVVYLRDVFESRMNTIFKFYYSAWLLLGLAAAVAAGLALFRPRWRWAGALAALALAGGLAYPVRALWSEAAAGRWIGLDARAALPVEEARLLAWIDRQTDPADVVVEAAGDSYHAEQNRISSQAGRPTLLGWQGHEAQWRGGAYAGMVAGRTLTLQSLYLPASGDELRLLMQRGRLRYLQVGPRERAEYRPGAPQEAAWDAGLARVYDDGRALIFKAPPAPRGP